MFDAHILDGDTSHVPLVVGLLALLALAALATRLPRTEVAHPGLQLVRVLVPSWRFFDDVQDVPRLHARYGRDEDALGPWLEVIDVPPRRLRALLFNPEGNATLLRHAMLERLEADLAALDDRALAEGRVQPEQLVGYELVLNLVRCSPHAVGQRYCQFELVHPSTHADRGDERVVVSLVHPVHGDAAQEDA